MCVTFMVELSLYFRDEFRMKWVDDTHALGIFSSTSLGKVIFLMWPDPYISSSNSLFHILTHLEISIK